MSLRNAQSSLECSNYNNHAIKWL